MPPPLVEPSRAAHASLGGYLYQVYLGVERWLELGPDEVLRCEGDEDLDRLLLDGSGGVSEQVKALTGKINLRDEVMKGTLRRFVVSHYVLRTGEPPDERRFVFTSTAERRRQKLDPALPIDALEAWEDAKGDEAVRGQVVAALHTLLPFLEPDKGEHPGLHLFWHKLQTALKWLDAKPMRWGDLLASIEWKFDAPPLLEVRAKIQKTLRSWDVPDGFFDRLVGEILEASTHRDPKERLRTQEDRDRILKLTREELANWRTNRGERLVRVLNDLENPLRVLYEKSEKLPSPHSPGQLLSATYEVIPFEEEGRREILEDLADWCTGKETKGIRLLYGEGGTGKTRLLMELCHRLGAQGWRAGFLEPKALPEELVALLEGVIPRLIVLDYAEGHLEIGQLLVSRLAHREGGAKVRIVFLARRQEDWWETMARDPKGRDLLARTPPRPVEDLFADEQGREVGFSAAARAFAEDLGRELPLNLPLPALEDPVLGRPLVLHMAAFLVAFGKSPGTLGEVLAEILQHEKDYWDWMIDGFHFNREEKTEVRRALGRAAVLLTLLGGVSDEEAARALIWKALPAGTSDGRAETLLTLLRNLYGATAKDQRFLRAMEPDLLGEELVRQGLTRQPALLSLALELGTEGGRWQLLTVLARLARKPESTEVAEAWLRQAYIEALEPLAEIALDVAVAQGDPVGRLLAPVLQRQASAELMQKLMERCNLFEFSVSTPLREVALVVTARAVEESRKKNQQVDPDYETQAELAKNLRWLGIRCHYLGQREDAPVATQEAVDLYQRLAKQRPDTFLPDLALSLNNLGSMLSDLGQHEVALKTIQEAVEIYRLLAEQQPDAFLSELAGSLNNLGKMLSALGQCEAALEAIQEAVKYHRRLAEHLPHAFLPYLAMSLSNLGSARGTLVQREAALEATQEAVDLYYQLAEQRPDAFLPSLAMSLNNLGSMRGALGQREAALEATQKAVDLYRQLAEQRPDAFLPSLALSLNNLGLRLSDLDQREDALEATQEALGLLRPYFLRHPAAFGDLMSWIKTSYEEAAGALGREPDRDLLDEIEAVLTA